MAKRRSRAKKSEKPSAPETEPQSQPEVPARADNGELILRGEQGREVRRQHLWRWGDSPVDPAQEDEPGWQRFKIRPLDTDTTVKTTRDMLAGGVESGMPCSCGTMTMWVQTVSALKIIEEAGMEVKGEERKKNLAKAMVAILVCPQCEAITQSPEDMARVMRQKYLARRDSNG